MTATMDLPINREASWRQTVGIVCPHCCKQTADFILFGPAKDHFGRVVRSYVGRCADCGISFEVEQYSVGELWPMYAYRIDRQPRTILQELPEPLLATGPGGDFVKTVSDQQMIDQCNKTIGMLTNVICCATTGIRATREILNQLCRAKH